MKHQILVLVKQQLLITLWFHHTTAPLRPFLLGFSFLKFPWREGQATKVVLGFIKDSYFLLHRNFGFSHAIHLCHPLQFLFGIFGKDG